MQVPYPSKRFTPTLPDRAEHGERARLVGCLERPRQRVGAHQGHSGAVVLSACGFLPLPVRDPAHAMNDLGGEAGENSRFFARSSELSFFCDQQGT